MAVDQVPGRSVHQERFNDPQFVERSGDHLLLPTAVPAVIERVLHDLGSRDTIMPDDPSAQPVRISRRSLPFCHG